MGVWFYLLFLPPSRGRPLFSLRSRLTRLYPAAATWKLPKAFHKNSMSRHFLSEDRQQVSLPPELLLDRRPHRGECVGELFGALAARLGEVGAAAAAASHEA